MTPAVQAIVAHGAHDLRLDSIEMQPLGEGSVEVRTAVGGICGSDLHYYHRGGVGDFLIQEPLILGHEVAGTVVRVGRGVSSVSSGDRVVIDPSAPCGRCAQCHTGRRNLCTSVRFLGSAARMPHSQGGFREQLVVDARQCVRIPDDLPLGRAVFAEPLAVAVHAIGRAGRVLGREVLIMGAGPIGMLCLLVAIRAGAAAVTITDLHDAPLQVARTLGAANAINVTRDPEIPPTELAIEASGSPAGLDTCLRSVEPGGRLVMLGLLPPGQTPVAANRAVTREIELSGSFRFVHAEFRDAVRMLSSGLDVSPLLTGRFAISDAVSAFEVAGRREEALKVQLQFSDADLDRSV